MTNTMASNRGMPRSLLATCLAMALGAGAAGADGSAGAGHAAGTWMRPWLDHAARNHAPRAPSPLAEQWKLLHPLPPPHPQGGVTHVVTNCDDDGPGSLREAVEGAASGDTIDMGTLACSTITLATGSIVTGVDDLALIGPGMNSLVIDGAGAFPVLVHVGAGQLYTRGFTAINGAKYASDDNDALGGCIYSQGNVFMSDAAAKYCLAQANGSGDALGGAVYARDGVIVFNSVISGSQAHSVSGSAFGGGLYTSGSASSKYATFRGNIASSGDDSGFGGAAMVGGNASITASTVHANTADHVGGLMLVGSGATTLLGIANSTIADNHALASAFGSGVYVGNDASITNSTITGNVEANPVDTKYGAGLSAKYGTTIDLQSTIISGNTITDGDAFLPSDIGAALGAEPPAITGSHNLIGATAADAPADTVVTADPGLGPLADNGGPTLTMLPLGGSMAINHGSGTSDYDQRGNGYPRLVGAAVDIGAVESDTIFADGFD